MGKGIALAFKQAFPANFKAYAEACERRGSAARADVRVRDRPALRILALHHQLPNQAALARQEPDGGHWSGLYALANEIREREIQSIALPPLGSGLGGLDWAAVRARIEEALGSLTTSTSSSLSLATKSVTSRPAARSRT